MLEIGTIVMGASDVRRAVDFWTRALGYVPRSEVTDDWTILVPANGAAGVALALDLSESPDFVVLADPGQPLLRHRHRRRLSPNVDM